jgi:hypothetical protein
MKRNFSLCFLRGYIIGSLLGGVLALCDLFGAAIATPTIRVPRVVNTTAQLVLVAPSQTTPDVFTLGRATATDGLGGLFYYDASSSTATNTNSVFKPTGYAGRWLERGGIGDLHKANFLGEFATASDRANAMSNLIYTTTLATTNGNVGIGTLTPSDLLHLSYSGNSTFKKLIVSNIGLTPGSDPSDREFGSLDFQTSVAARTARVVGYVPAGINGTDQNAIKFVVSKGGTPNTAMVIRESGNVGLGTPEPTAVVMLKAGTATANTAPLKFTSGTLTTTAEAGAMEFLTDTLYFTRTTGAVRSKIVTTTTGRVTAQTAANASVATHTAGPSDWSYEVSANVLVTTSGTENFTVTCVYTDEGNTARTLTLPFITLAGASVAIVNFANGAVPYEGVALHLRVKANTTITIATTGTFTGCTYSAEAVIKKI